MKNSEKEQKILILLLDIELLTFNEIVKKPKHSTINEIFKKIFTTKFYYACIKELDW